MLLVCAAFLHGMEEIQHPAGGRALRLSLVQANIPQTLKWDPAEKPMILDRFERLTRDWALPYRPDLILWPEAATPEPVLLDEVSRGVVTKLAAQAGVPLLIGSIDYDVRVKPVEGFNAALLMLPDGTVARSYRKLHLVPFGEYVPLVKLFPFMRYVTPIEGGFEPGTEYTTFELGKEGRAEGGKNGMVEGWNGGRREEGESPQSSSLPTFQSSSALPPIRFAVVICFEDTVADVYRRFARRDVDFMVNLTNDGWFKTSPAAELHLANAVFRAVETRRPLVRCTNTGVTCVVDEHGFVRARLEPFTAGVQNVELALPAVRGPPTFYTRRGDVFTGLCALISVLTVTIAIVDGRARANRAR
jgi:apolipoprotein N-acyltransferase